MSNELEANPVIPCFRTTVKKVSNRLATEDNTEVTTEVKKTIQTCKKEQSSIKLQQLSGLNEIYTINRLTENSVIRKFRITANQGCFRKPTIKPVIEQGLLEMTIPDKPNSSKQKYRLSDKGLFFREGRDSNDE